MKIDVGEREETGEQRQDEADDRDEVQRVAGEADDPVHPDHERAEEAVVLPLSTRPRIAIVENLRLGEAHDGDEAA